MSPPPPLARPDSPAWTVPAIRAESIPDELRALPQWVCWRRVARDGKSTKVPFRADLPEAEASTTDPSTWSGFASALASALEPDHRLDGVGFVFTGADPYVGIDLDNALAADGTGIELWAREVLEAVPGYAEVTPSGRGLHLITRGECPGGKGRRRGGLMPVGGVLECYDRGRYFTFTGHVFGGRREVAGSERPFAEVHGELFPAKGDRRRAAAPPDAPRLGDAELVHRALAARNGDKFGRLWGGDRAGYPSPSEADLALCSLLTFYSQDPATIDRLFRQSGLSSAKWTDRPDYRELTIGKALERAEVYRPGHANGHAPARPGPAREPGDDDPDEGEDPDALLPPDEEVISVRMSDVERKEVRWLFPDRIPIGKVTLVAGDPGLGKSFLTMDLIARVTTGGPIPAGGGECVPRGPVVLLCAEDDLADTVGPRLDAAGADTSEVHVLQTLVLPGGRREPFNLTYMPHLERMIVRANRPKLVVIDPVTSYVGAVDDHKNSSLRSVLGPLAELAARREVAVLIVTHLNKSSGSKALNRITGSLAYVALARVAWLVVRDPEDPERRLFLSVKNNLAPEPSGLSYRIDRQTRRVVWDDAPILMTANEALQAHSDREQADRKGGDHEPRVNRGEQARDFLLEMLAGGREMPHEELVALARARGISKNAIFEARESAGVRPHKVGFQGKWFWSIPAADPPEEPDAPI